MPGFNIPNVDPGCNDANLNNDVGYTGPVSAIEIARNHRWIFEVLEPFGSLSDGILLYARKCTRPSPEIEEITIHHSQEQITRPGKHKWNPIEFSFYEKVTGTGSPYDEVALKIYEWWATSMLVLEQSRYNDLSYLKTGALQMVDGSGFAIWQYRLFNCWPSKVTPSELDYSNTDLAEITVTLRYDKAIEGVF